MRINDVQFNCEALDIVEELVTQLRLNGINYIQKYKDSPDNVQICCPYHNNGQERRPSAGIRKSDGLFHCFACGEVHSLAEVVSHCFGQDGVGIFGWQWLLKNFATIEVGERDDIELDYSRDSNLVRNTALSGGQKNYSFVTEEELDSYRYIHPYMYERKLTDEIIEIFDVGYDVATESITFPVRDIFGRCLFVARRSVKTKWFNYPKGVEKSLYGLYEIQNMFPIITYDKSGKIHIDDYPHEIIVCESMLDALTCWVYGKYAVALNGLGNELAIKQLNDMPCRKVILATDKDEAGRQARVKLRKVIKNKLITEFDYNSYPKGAKDINDMTKEEFDNLQEVF